MAHQDCIICGESLIYSESGKELVCVFCGNKRNAKISCSNDHFVCDDCHSAQSREIIITCCMNSKSKNPIDLATLLMKHPSFKMHGIEHHFLVPAVLLTTYCNATGQNMLINEKINQANQRSRNILGGFCGFYGACGAAIGAGIFMSLITGATPLSINEWGYANNITANALLKISQNGGPRCCKKTVYISILTAIDFLKEKFNINLEKTDPVKCEFVNNNAQCMFERCGFYSYSKIVQE